METGILESIGCVCYGLTKVLNLFLCWYLFYVNFQASISVSLGLPWVPVCKARVVAWLWSGRHLCTFSQVHTLHGLRILCFFRRGANISVSIQGLIVGDFIDWLICVWSSTSIRHSLPSWSLQALLRKELGNSLLWLLFTSLAFSDIIKLCSSEE